ncbi:hypothetical protein FB45DRAFT_859564 [Roridomyces roridus]|uniref:Uncharacterized protein n=1 Tax=Roridomyces roridus TaxID=1738132 RepID=A0AAD7CK66_9AGAR|nr:hypothetical protein FB45DRAFT_859564 [Roridomyces roridus]
MSGAPYGHPDPYNLRYSTPNTPLYHGPGQPGPPVPMPPAPHPALNYGYAHMPPRTFEPIPLLPTYELQSRVPPPPPQGHPTYGHYRPRTATQPPALPPPIQLQVPQSTGYAPPPPPPIQLKVPQFAAYAPPPPPPIQFQVGPQFHAVLEALPPPVPPPMSSADLLVERVRDSMRQIFETHQRQLDADTDRLQEKIDRLSAEISSTRKETGEYVAQISDVLRTSREVQLGRLKKLESILGVSLLGEGDENAIPRADGRTGTLADKLDSLEAGVDRILEAFRELEQVEDLFDVPARFQDKSYSKREFQTKWVDKKIYCSCTVICAPTRDTAAPLLESLVGSGVSSGRYTSRSPTDEGLRPPTQLPGAALWISDDVSSLLSMHSKIRHIITSQLLYAYGGLSNEDLQHAMASTRFKGLHFLLPPNVPQPTFLVKPPVQRNTPQTHKDR